MSQVKVYGADWCGMTRRTQSFLDQLGIDYDYINVEKDERAVEVGKRAGRREREEADGGCGRNGAGGAR